jgi:hypothetical protein
MGVELQVHLVPVAEQEVVVVLVVKLAVLM